MRSSVYVEARRTATTKLTLVLAAVLAITAAASVLVAPSAVSVPSIATVYFYEAGAYHLMGYVYDAEGHPMTGVPVTFGSPQGLPPGGTTGGTTDGQGVVHGVFPSNRGNYTYTLTASTSSGTTTVSTEVTSWPVPSPNGTVLPGFGDIIPVRSGTYTSTGDLLAFFAGPNGSAPGGYVLQYHFATFDLMEQPTGGSPDQLTVPKNFVNQYVLSNFSTYSTVAAVDLATPPTGFGPSILAQIAAPNGSIVADAILPPTDFGPQSTTTPAAQAVQLVLTEVGLVSLVIGILGGIALYGSDRLSGALEPYLARPITPEGFVGARYVGLLLPLLGGVIAGLLVADAALSVRYGAAMPPALLAVAIASAAGGLAAWIGVPIALSRVTRSQIRLLTYALGIVVVFGFFWTPALISIGPWVGAGPGTLAGATLDFDAQMFNPALAPSTLVIPALLGTGLATVAGIVVDLAVWGILPIGFALWWTRRRD